MILNKHFPSIIGTEMNSNHKNIQDKLIDRCYNLKNNIKKGGEEWLSQSTYNTIGKYNIFFDSKFLQLNQFIITSVKNYCKLLNIKENSIDYTPTDAWFNIYKKGDYQEYHSHNDSLISVVYFLKANINSAKIFFKNRYLDMIQPIYNHYTPDTFERVTYTPEPGLALIFRSHLEHSVEKHNDKEERISVAYNFKKK
jgi:uncharacterized protein (TIGR02466 family)